MLRMRSAALLVALASAIVPVSSQIVGNTCNGIPEGQDCASLAHFCDGSGGIDAATLAALRAQCPVTCSTCSAPPTAVPTDSPTTNPTDSPSVSPTTSPTTTGPTVSPTTSPTTTSPTTSPTTSSPTVSPTLSPTTTAPTLSPSTSPTGAPSARPTAAPTSNPVAAPTFAPSARPTAGPTESPTAQPSAVPTTLSPTASPSAAPTASPTDTPTGRPTAGPTDSPSANPTGAPTTATPSVAPSAQPTQNPSLIPTVAPTAAPSGTPTTLPPSVSPTAAPTAGPTLFPTATPTGNPTTANPTAAPSASPTSAPTRFCRRTPIHKACFGEICDAAQPVIRTAQECEFAAVDLGLDDVGANLTNNASYPAGCYYKPFNAGFAQLWFNSNFTLVTPNDPLRVPVCGSRPLPTLECVSAGGGLNLIGLNTSEAGSGACTYSARLLNEILGICPTATGAITCETRGDFELLLDTTVANLCDTTAAAITAALVELQGPGYNGPSLAVQCALFQHFFVQAADCNRTVGQLNRLLNSHLLGEFADCEVTSPTTTVTTTVTSSATTTVTSSQTTTATSTQTTSVTSTQTTTPGASRFVCLEKFGTTYLTVAQNQHCPRQARALAESLRACPNAPLEDPTCNEVGGDFLLTSTACSNLSASINFAVNALRGTATVIQNKEVIIVPNVTLVAGPFDLNFSECRARCESEVNCDTASTIVRAALVNGSITAIEECFTFVDGQHLNLRDRVNGQVYNSDGTLTETIGCAFDHLFDTADNLTQCNELARDLNLVVDSTLDGSFPACGITAAPTIAPNDPGGIPSTGAGSTGSAASAGSIMIAVVICLLLALLVVALVVRRARRAKEGDEEAGTTATLNDKYATADDVEPMGRTLTVKRGRTGPTPESPTDDYATCAGFGEATNPLDYETPSDAHTYEVASSPNSALYATAAAEGPLPDIAENPALYDTAPPPAVVGGVNPGYAPRGRTESVTSNDSGNKAGYIDCELPSEAEEPELDQIEPLYADGDDADALDEDGGGATAVEPKGLIRKESWRAMLTDSRRASMSSTRSGIFAS